MFSAATKSSHPSGSVNWIDDVFSTWLYTGNASTRDILNGIDLSTKGGMVWIKNRGFTDRHNIQDTVRGINSQLSSNLIDAETTSGNQVKGFYTNGFQLGYGDYVNRNNYNYVSWTFAKQAKFFDVVTYTGNGVAGRTVSHNLGSTPGCIIIKSINNLTDPAWVVVHRGMNWTQSLLLNQTDAAGGDYTNSTAPTSTVFSVSEHDPVNKSGNTYVAYLFAHDAGGFGTSGTDNVISCGSFADSAGATVNLGYEPQWVLIKSINSVSDWYLLDNMRGFDNSGMNRLEPNLSSAEVRETPAYYVPTATGFKDAGGWLSGSNCIYIAIRRPMKPPTSGTSVFQPVTYTGTGSNNREINTTIAPDFTLFSDRTKTFYSGTYLSDKLRGITAGQLMTNGTDSEYSNPTETISAFGQSGVTFGSASFNGYNSNGLSGILWNFCRASTFFDIVCYTGTGSATTQNHNLAAVPELMIVKKRNSSSVSNWMVYAQPLGATKRLVLNAIDAATTYTAWNNTAPTSTVFSIDTNYTNQSGDTFVAYLFATVAGVSKVGSYTGTGTTKQVDCGFTGGARFVLIKRTDSTGAWYVWDSARGIVSGNDPYLLLNSAAAEVTNTDYVDTYSAGFEISSTAPAAINANGGSFIFLAIA